MEMKYYCNNCKCEKERKEKYVLTIKLDSIMDEKNLAQMFCPHCKAELKTK